MDQKVIEVENLSIKYNKSTERVDNIKADSCKGQDVSRCHTPR